MSVLAMGADVVDIPTFAAQMALPGSRLAEVFTARERRRATRRAEESGTAAPDSPGHASAHLAAVWAAKEAFIKAWSGALYGKEPVLGRDDIDFGDIEVLHDSWGRPSIALRGDLAPLVDDSLGGPVRLLTSASHDGDVACAVVIVERP